MSHVGFEPVAVDRPVYHQRRVHADLAKASHQRGGLAVAMREAQPQPLAFPAAPLNASHVGGGLGLINEYEAFGIEVDLNVEPVPTLFQDVGTVQLNLVPSRFCA